MVKKVPVKPHNESDMFGEHDKSQPEEEETNPLILALRGAKGERKQEILRLKKELQSDLEKKIKEFIELLDISQTVAEAARLGKTRVVLDIRNAELHFQRFYNVTDVFNFVENKSMELRFEKKWHEFWQEFIKTVAVLELKGSHLVQEAYKVGVEEEFEVKWPLYPGPPPGPRSPPSRLNRRLSVIQPHEYVTGGLDTCDFCGHGRTKRCHQPSYHYPDRLVMKWD